MSALTNINWNSKNIFVSGTIASTKKIATNFTVAFIATVFFKLCTSGELSIPNPIFFAGSMLVCNLFNEREVIYRTYLMGRNYFDRKFNKSFIELAIKEIRNQLTSEMGERWLKIKSLTLDEGIKYFSKNSLSDYEVCDGEVLSFLNVINNSPPLKDSELENKIKPIECIKYQVMRQLKVEVTNDHLKSNSLPCDTFLNFCKQYDPYNAFADYLIYHQLAGKLAAEQIFIDMQKAVQKSLNKNCVLAGKISYLGGSVVGHSICIQLTDHYRYRDAVIYSFKGIEELFKSIYQLSNDYLKTYDKIALILWELPKK